MLKSIKKWQDGKIIITLSLSNKLQMNQQEI